MWWDWWLPAQPIVNFFQLTPAPVFSVIEDVKDDLAVEFYTQRLDSFLSVTTKLVCEDFEIANRYLAWTQTLLIATKHLSGQSMKSES